MDRLDLPAQPKSYISLLRSDLKTVDSVESPRQSDGVATADRNRSVAGTTAAAGRRWPDLHPQGQLIALPFRTTANMPSAVGASSRRRRAATGPDSPPASHQKEYPDDDARGPARVERDTAIGQRSRQAPATGRWSPARTTERTRRSPKRTPLPPHLVRRPAHPRTGSDVGRGSETRPQTSDLYESEPQGLAPFAGASAGLSLGAAPTVFPAPDRPARTHGGVP